MPTAVESSLVYGLKLWLCGIEPLIWRKVEVPAAITLPKLHRVIQVVIGWEDCHLHQFRIGQQVYEILDPYESYGTRALDERRVKLASVVDKIGSEFRYLYDLGDDWEHRLLVEDILGAQTDVVYPRCTAGARSGPPEDVGGPPGYQEYLEALADPTHDQHAEMLEWRGPFNPEQFDLESVNWKLAREFKSRRQPSS